MIKRVLISSLLPGAIILFLIGALIVTRQHPANAHRESAAANAPQQPVAPDPLRIALTPIDGDDAADVEIRALQNKVASSAEPNPLLERLGWAFVAKARLSSDPGFYKLAETAGQAILRTAPHDAGAELLLGHIDDAMHRFADAEKIARQLTSEREFVFDYALLGDALMEQGKLGEAVDAYQKMVDLKPCLQTYSRVAHMRWLKGDLPGAIAASRLAVSAGSPREGEASAWAHTRLALYQMQENEPAAASTSIDLALQLAPEYAPALLTRGKLFLSEGKSEEAIAPLERAAEISPLPDYLWTLADALRAAGKDDRAAVVEAKLMQTGAVSDPRTFSLFLSTRGKDPALAVRLATDELKNRQDIFSYDALAWADLADGHIAEACANMKRALAEGTQDARLFYHAGAIAAAAGDQSGAAEFLQKAQRTERLLLPSERAAIARQASADQSRISAN
ncbi:MAG: hypothetical protein M3Y86_10065 [Verrucomicrobiota bacterium]|nr:hypothetical protein [Verrucomicrobiota bacterium]